MPPKEKSIELVNLYYNKIEHTISNEYSKVTKEISKQCALIAVDEILNINPYKARYYWQEVKQEIENL